MPVNAQVRKDRYAAIRRKLSGLGLDAFLVSGESDLLYMTGYAPVPPARLFIPRKGLPVYLIDPMNDALARKMIKGLGQRESVLAAKDRQEAVGSLLKDRKIRRLGISESGMSVREYKALVGGVRKLLPRDASSIMEEMRMVKNRHEISVMRKAAKETVSIWKEFSRRIRTGMSEKELAAELEAIIFGRGYTPSFPAIVAAGRNTAYPHACPTQKRLHKGEHVLVDFGIKLANYCSDLTRTWDNGRIDRQLRDFRKFVLEARDKAIGQIRPGLAVGSPAASANKYFESKGMGQYVRHSLGHGIGLCVHERPFLRGGGAGRLKKGMVVTVEPGLYSEGLGGIREEDMVLVTEKGCEVLTA